MQQHTVRENLSGNDTGHQHASNTTEEELIVDRFHQHILATEKHPGKLLGQEGDTT